MKTILLLAAIFIGSIRTLSAQCIEAPAYTPLTGTEPLVTAGETLLPSQTKYFYGGPVTLNNIHLRGGKLIVSGQITLDNFGFETGELVVLPGGSVVVNNPTGLVLRGNCAIYNWGNFQCLGNIVLDYGTTSATRPNLIINASASANFRMPNQYFLINNPWSKFVNMGTAEFHGIITDPGAAAGSVCLGDTSVTTMRVLYNNAKNTYAVPSGSACLGVQLYSQFRDTLTSYPTLNVCLGPTHYSDSSCIPWGCKPNAWGEAHLFRNCSSCEGTWVLPSYKIEARAEQQAASVLLRWQTNPVTSVAKQRVEKSVDGSNFYLLNETIAADENGFVLKDKTATNGASYYRISVASENSEHAVASKIVFVKTKNSQVSVYPNPFQNDFFIRLQEVATLPTVLLYNSQGQAVQAFVSSIDRNVLQVRTAGLPRGIYSLHITDGKSLRVFKLVKQ